MALSDCVMCWDTPCTCGYQYLRWTNESLKDFTKTLSMVIKFKESNPELFNNIKMPYGWDRKVHDEIWKKFKLFSYCLREFDKGVRR